MVMHLATGSVWLGSEQHATMRGYANAQEMVDDFVFRWNATVRANAPTRVYVLGNMFADTVDPERAERILLALNGVKMFAYDESTSAWERSLRPWAESAEQYTLTTNGVSIRLQSRPVPDYAGPELLIHGSIFVDDDGHSVSAAWPRWKSTFTLPSVYYLSIYAKELSAGLLET